MPQNQNTPSAKQSNNEYLQPLAIASGVAIFGFGYSYYYRGDVTRALTVGGVAFLVLFWVVLRGNNLKKQRESKASPPALTDMSEVSKRLGWWPRVAVVCPLLLGLSIALYYTVGTAFDRAKTNRSLRSEQDDKVKRVYSELSAQEIKLTPVTAIAPFDAAQAKTFQAAWANYLGVPVEFTNSINMGFAVIPPGEFMMGSPESEPGRLDNERYRKVVLGKPFLIGITEVTQSQYESVMGKNRSAFKGAGNPVEKVSWDDAVEFCQKLSALPAEQAAGRVYRLPREDEWEFACRAGTTTAFSFGDDASLADRYVWFKQNSGGETHAVAEKLPNAWGLFDMHGNVFEWCEIEPAGNHSFLNIDSKGLHETWGQVYRGGAWINSADRLRSASRSVYKSTFHYHYLGFRAALDCPPSGQVNP